MKNTLTDLNNHLFAQLERLGDEDLSADELAREIERSNSITSVAKQVIDNGRLVLDAHTRTQDAIDATQQAPRLLT